MSLRLLHLIIFWNFFTLCDQQPFTIMIDPIGDAKHTGREIEDTFERGISFQFAQELKKELSDKIPNIRVILTRVPGETVQPLQNASFANRLNVDFYISVSFYHEPTIPTYITLFYYLEQPTDSWHQYNPLQFYHVSQAHLINLNITQQIAKSFVQILQKKSINTAFSVRGIFAIPCNALLGITAPSILLDTGLRHKDDWKYLIKPLIACIETIVP